MTLRTMLMSVVGFAVICALWFVQLGNWMILGLQALALFAVVISFCAIVCRKRRAFAIGFFLPATIASMGMLLSIEFEFPLLDSLGAYAQEPSGVESEYTVKVPYTVEVTSTYTVSIPYDAVIVMRHRNVLAWLGLGIVLGLAAQSFLVDDRRSRQTNNTDHDAKHDAVKNPVKGMLTRRTMLISVIVFAAVCVLWLLPWGSWTQIFTLLLVLVTAVVSFGVILCKRQRSFAAGIFIPAVIAVVSLVTTQAEFPLLNWRGMPMSPAKSVSVPYTASVRSNYYPLSYRQRHSLSWMAVGVGCGMVACLVIKDETQPEEK